MSNVEMIAETEADKAFKSRIDIYKDILKNKSFYLPMLEETQKLIRSEYSDLNKKDSVLYLYSMAPMLLEFNVWLMEKCKKDKIDRLYFLSRDGYQLYLIAKKYIEVNKLDVECKYLHVSRYSMKIPGYCKNPEKAIDSICVGGIDTTLGKIIRRGGLTDAECEEVISETNLQDMKDKILNYKQVVELREKLKKSNKLKEYICEKSEAARRETLGYLRQEGLFDKLNYALVDSGWIGTLQLAIESLVERKVRGYYFGMYEMPVKTAKERFNAFYFDATSGLTRKKIFSNSLFETIVSAPEGMTIGYKSTEEGYTYETKDKANSNKEQIERNIKVLELLLENMSSEADKKAYDYKKSLEFVKDICWIFMSNPTEVEVECFGNCTFSDDVLEAGKLNVAADLTKEEINNGKLLSKLLIVSGLKKAVIKESAWIEGSVVKAHGSNSGKELKAIRRYKHVMFLRKQMRSKLKG